MHLALKVCSLVENPGGLLPGVVVLRPATVQQSPPFCVALPLGDGVTLLLLLGVALPLLLGVALPLLLGVTLILVGVLQFPEN